MNFLDLECFLVAAEERSFTRAAHRLYISQQSLSAHIIKLEEYFKAKLFERTTPLTLTSAGQYLFDHSKTMLMLKEHIETEMQERRNYENNLLSVGILANRGTVLIQSILPRFQEEHPEIKMKISEMLDDSYYTALQNGFIDLMLGYDMKLSIATFIPLLEEEYFFVVPEAILMHYFSEDQQEKILTVGKLPISVFRNCPFLACGQIGWLREAFEACCREHGIIPNIFVETSSLLTRLSLCLAGLGIMFISGSIRSQCQAILGPSQLAKIHFIEVDYQIEPEYRFLGLNYLTKRQLSLASKQFIHVAKKTFATTPAHN